MRRLIRWLGTGRVWALFMLLAGTGLMSLVLQAFGGDAGWVIPLQNGLILAWLFGSVMVLISAFDPLDRRPLLISVGPLLLGIAIGILVPAFLPWFAGAGVGWLVLSQLLLRRGVRREYQRAIRHLRNNEYDQAVVIMNELIKAEPGEANHYRFRGDLYRLQGKPEKALKDYRQVVKLEPESGVGYNGVAEIYLQEGDFEQAREYAYRAYETEPEHWVMPYNLGMIEDRLGAWADAVQHLQEALAARTPDSRHRLLIHLWLARAYAHLDEREAAQREVEAVRKEKRGLNEWQTIFESEEARTLRHVLGEDVALARRIFEGAGVDVLTDTQLSVEAEQ